MSRVRVQPDTEETRAMVRRHAEAWMRGGPNKEVVAEMRKIKPRSNEAKRRRKERAR